LFGSADLTGAFLGADKADNKAHSKARTPVVQIAKAMKRTEGALRRKAGILGIGLGHDR
jgi:hypothetical protein